jgi:hypothetical protein
MTYIVYSENASYWDVGEEVEQVPDSVERIREPGEQVLSKVCRVHKHFTGAKHLALILSGPELLEACKAWMLVESERRENNPCPDLALRAEYRKRAVAMTTAAIAKVESKS